MTTRSVVLAIDTTTIPRVGTLLAERGVNLGPVIGQTARLRCFTVQGEPHLPLPIGGLSRRDLTLIRGFAEGLGYREIAELLNVGEATVKEHARKLYRRLGVQDRAETVAVAYRMGVLNSWQEVAA